MKKIFCLLLGILMLLGGFACGEPADESSSQDPENPPSEDIYGGEKKTLMFEIDEGMCGVEFVAGCKNTDGSYDYDRMDLIMNNIYEGIKDLKPLYDVAVHIYFNWYYDADGWGGKDPADPINRWDPALLYALDFFREKEIGVYFEWMSSGNYTNQNGELGTLPLVDIYLGTEGKEERFVKGISADIASVKALQAAYSDVFWGVRFHELIGTHNGGVAGNPHCYTIEEQDVYALIDACADMGIELVWSDHSWSEMYAMTENEMWQRRVKYAEEKLGEDLTVMWANNAGGYLVDYLNFSLYDEFERDFPTANTGFSAQNWIMSSFYLLRGPESVTGPAECDTPVELTAGIAIAAFMNGAKIVQFEPSYQFFNWPRSLYAYDALGQGGDIPGKGSLMPNYTPPASQIEGDDCDYSPRVELKRFVEILNSKSTQFANVADFFDESMTRIFSNDVQDPPKTYSQSTVMVTDAEGNRRFLDHYNNDAETWLEQNENRFTDRVFNSEVIASGHVICNDHAYDEVITVVKENGRNVGYFYNARSCFLSRNTTIFADNDKGEFVGFTTANLIKNRVSTVNMDCDEIVVAREKDGQINLSLYQAMPKTVSTVDKSGNFVYQEVTSEVDSFILVRMLGGKTLDAENFLGLVGVRDRITIGKQTRLRELDGLFAVYATDTGVELIGRLEKGGDRLTLPVTVDGKVTAAAAGDFDLDVFMTDELLLAVEKDGQTKIFGYQFASGSLLKQETELDLGACSVDSLTTFRKSFFIYDADLDN